MSIVAFASYVITAVILGLSLPFGRRKIIRKAQPESWHEIIVYLVVISISLLTAMKWPLFPATSSVVLVAAVMFTLGLLSPLLGLIENRYRQHGDEIYAVSRFYGHLRNNLLGALTVLLFFWAGQSTEGFTQFARQFSDAAAFNVVAPLSLTVVFAFIRQQQVEACVDLDQLVRDKGDWESRIRGCSLRSAHQLTNCIFLVAVLFVGASTVLYLFAYTIVQAKRSTPIVLSWQLTVAMIALLAFLFACGTPSSWNNTAVYFTFLTGTPAALIAALMWLALLASTVGRNVFAALLVGVGYAAYCTAAIFGVLRRKHSSTHPHPPSDKSVDDEAAGDGAEPNNTTPDMTPQETIELHYFAAAILAVALTVMLGALYVSQ